MFAERNGLSFADKKNTKRRHWTFSSTMSKEEEMNVLQPGFTIEGKDCLLMGESGAGKTLAALGLSYALATGAPILDDLYGIPEPRQGATVWVGSDGGDGAFGISMNEMSSCAREEWPAITMVIFRNYQWGA